MIRLRNFMLGKPRDPFDTNTRKSLSLIAFMAWVGLGADGISSSCYGPEEAFLALGTHEEVAIYLAIATAFTVFIISYAYTQVIELFPNGGGGYRVATRLLGPYAGLVSGSALIIDYVLTISISVASGIDAMFSFFPLEFQWLKIFTAILLVILLAFLNLRGMKESIKFLMPIFLGFILTHVSLIFYGIFAHRYGLSELVPKAIEETQSLGETAGLLFVISLFLKAFSMGGGTYTGLEAVSNNVNTLSEPRIKTAKLTMLMLAISLAFMAAGIILLYLLWGVSKTEGQTLNASVFYIITETWSLGGVELGPIIVPILLLLETGLLLVAANSGLLAGPQVIANMASDEWMPKSFSSLSSRLVVKNGILFMSIAAIITLLITGGVVRILVVLYSINVFITFSMSLLGLTIYWIRHRHKPKWRRKFIVALIGFIVCVGILAITIFEKFYEGGWITILITSVFIGAGFMVRQQYHHLKASLEQSELQFADYKNIAECFLTEEKVDKSAPTAAIILDQTFGSGMNCLLQIKKLFPGIFKNFIFVTVGELDSNIFSEEKKWREMRRKTKSTLRKYRNYCNANGRFAKSYVGYGTDIAEKLSQLTNRVMKDYPNTTFFGTKFIFDNENMFTQLLYNHTAYIMQRRLHNKGKTMVVLPMQINLCQKKIEDVVKISNNVAEDI
ncbi:MAG: APC family permease [Rickettsiales bacterium]|nr:APC family permease [Rickettsiales bacterium]